MLLQAWVVLFFVVAISAHPNSLLATNTIPLSTDKALKGCAEYEDMNKATADFHTCFKGVVEDYGQLTTEIDVAKTNRSELNKLVKRYCDKTPMLKTCLHAYVDKLMPCGKIIHRTFFTISQLDQDIDYICHNDGERLASLISAKGIDCIQISQRNSFHQCGDTALSDMSIDDKAAFDADALSHEKHCAFTDRWFECLVTSYKSCDPATPGTIVEGLLSFMRRNSVCNDLVPKN